MKYKPIIGEIIFISGARACNISFGLGYNIGHVPAIYLSSAAELGAIFLFVKGVTAIPTTLK